MFLGFCVLGVYAYTYNWIAHAYPLYALAYPYLETLNPLLFVFLLFSSWF